MHTSLLAPALCLLALPFGDPSGSWNGRLVSAGMSGSLQLELRRDGARLSGDATLRSGPNTVHAPLEELAVDGDVLGFTLEIEGAACRFDGQLAGDTLTGQFEVREGGQLLDRGDWSAARGDAAPTELLSSEDARVRPGEADALVASLAIALRDRYVDAELGAAMALRLQERAAAGAFAATSDTRVLADLIGRELFEVAGDAHLKVSFTREPAPAEPATGPVDATADDDALRAALRLENFGFRRTEILPGNVGLLELSRFARADLAGEAASLAMGFLQHCDALVIDLRACGGGDPAMVAFLASWLFEGPATHVATMQRREDELTVQWWTAPWVPYRGLARVPVRVLIASRTQSAAEALAFHLQSLGRARVVGERSGGAAHPSRRVRVGERFTVLLPTSRSVDPATGGDWEGTGVLPDIAVPAADALRAAHLDLLETLAGTAEPARASELHDVATELRRGT